MRARGQGPFGRQFKYGCRAKAIYSKDLVLFGILLHTRPSLALRSSLWPSDWAMKGEVAWLLFLHYLGF